MILAFCSFILLLSEDSSFLRNREVLNNLIYIFLARSKLLIPKFCLSDNVHVIARCAILFHEPKIAEATLVSSPPRSPPFGGLPFETNYKMAGTEGDRSISTISRKNRGL